MDTADLRDLLHEQADEFHAPALQSNQIIAAVHRRRRRRTAGAAVLAVGLVLGVTGVTSGSSSGPAEIIPAGPSASTGSLTDLNGAWDALVKIDVTNGSGPTRRLTMTGDLITGVPAGSDNRFALSCEWPVSQEASSVTSATYRCHLALAVNGIPHSGDITMQTDYFSGVGTFEFPGGGLVTLTDPRASNQGGDAGPLWNVKQAPYLDRARLIEVSVFGTKATDCQLSRITAQHDNGDGTTTYTLSIGGTTQNQTLPDRHWNPATASDALIARLGLPARPKTNGREPDGTISTSTNRDEWVHAFAHINTPPQEMTCNNTKYALHRPANGG